MTLVRREQPLERLVDANPTWVDTGPGNTKDPNRRGIGLSFDCPIHDEGRGLARRCRLYVPVDPPLDGGPVFDERGWKRSGGEAFDEVTLSPSIRMLGGEDGCRWHGFIRGGRFETCGDAR